jgi:acyl-coenzyme A thioesterase PaaI-like protein
MPPALGNAASPHMLTLESGEFAGWHSWALQGPYERYSGPYAFLVEPQGIRCAFRAEARHLNGVGTVYGGCLMSFADFALASIASPAIADHAVTVSLHTEMLAPVLAAQRVEATGQIVRPGRLVFVQGLATVESRPVMSFSGILRNVTTRQPQSGAN